MIQRLVGQLEAAPLEAAPRRILPAFTFAVLAAVLTCGAGCVKRTMVVRSDPSGAPVWVDETYVGRTPVDVPFVFYGTRKVQVGPIREEAEPAPAKDGEKPKTAEEAAEKAKPEPESTTTGESKTEDKAETKTEPETKPESDAVKAPETAPAKEPFVHEAAGRKITHRKVVEMVRLKTPWWDTFPIDFFANVLLPIPIHHKQEVVVTLPPVGVAEEAEGLKQAEEVHRRAEAFRKRGASPTPELLPPLKKEQGDESKAGSPEGRKRPL